MKNLQHFALSPTFAAIARLLPVAVMPAWAVRVALDPVLDHLTPDAAPYLMGPHPSDVGENMACEAMGRTGLACAIHNNLVSKGVLKPGVSPHIFYSNAAVAKRTLRDLYVRVLRQNDGALVSVQHTELRAAFLHLTAVELLAYDAQHNGWSIRVATHERAQLNAALAVQALAKEHADELRIEAQNPLCDAIASRLGCSLCASGTPVPVFGETLEV